MTANGSTPTTITVDGLLFDMDGTLIDSTPAVVATWTKYCAEFGIDLEHVLKTSHGCRTQDNMRNYIGLTDPQRIAEETERFEATIVAQAQRLQAEGKNGLKILPAVHELLTTLNSAPKPVWAIVTSATTKYASMALPTAAVPEHHHLVTADHVTKGKPHPEPYQAGAERLGLDVTKCVVVEDAPSGIKSGKAAGAYVLAVCTSHPRAELEGLGADWIVEDLSHVSAKIIDGKVALTIAP